MAKDCIPVRDKDFNGWFRFLNQYVAQIGRPHPGIHIPQAARTAPAGACAAAIGPHTPVDTEAKAVIRPFVNQYLRYPSGPVRPVRANAASSGAIIRHAPSGRLPKAWIYGRYRVRSHPRRILLPEFSRQG
jgi:hypothetical protein